MKKTTAIAALSAALLSPSLAHASHVEEYECAFVSQTPAPSKRETSSYKIKVQVIYAGPGLKLAGVAAVHTLTDGKEADRTEQYVDPVVRERDIAGGAEATWRGKYIRDPSIKMVGSLAVKKRYAIYTERQFKHDRLAWTLVSRCHEVEFNP
jgi:hypothetical protein